MAYYSRTMQIVIRARTELNDLKILVRSLENVRSRAQAAAEALSDLGARRRTVPAAGEPAAPSSRPSGRRADTQPSGAGGEVGTARGDWTTASGDSAWFRSESDDGFPSRRPDNRLSGRNWPGGRDWADPATPEVSGADEVLPDDDGAAGRAAKELAELEALNAAKADANQAFRDQELSRELVMLTQEERLGELRLTMAEQMAVGLGGIFQGLYALSGRQQREYFYLAKAAAVAEAIINVQQGVTKALAQGGIWGAVMAGVVAARGAVAIAAITAQQFAAGGLVRGWSPHPAADNVPAYLTAGEFVQPVGTVEHYGLGAMEALRRREVPREVLELFRGPHLPTYPTTHHFAAGGLVQAEASPGPVQAPAQSVTLINVLDRSELLGVLGSNEGSTVMWNWLSSNAPRIRKVLLD